MRTNKDDSTIIHSPGGPQQAALLDKTVILEFGTQSFALREIDILGKWDIDILTCAGVCAHAAGKMNPSLLSFSRSGHTPMALARRVASAGLGRVVEHMGRRITR